MKKEDKKEQGWKLSDKAKQALDKKAKSSKSSA